MRWPRKRKDPPPTTGSHLYVGDIIVDRADGTRHTVVSVEPDPDHKGYFIAGVEPRPRHVNGSMYRVEPPGGF